MQTKFLALAFLSASAVFGSEIERRQNSDFHLGLTLVSPGVDIGRATSAVGEFKSKESSLKAHVHSQESAFASLTSGADARWASATAAISSLDNRVKTEWDNVDGWSKIKSDVGSAISYGTASVDAFFATQTAVAHSAASSIKADLARSIIAAAASASSTASSTATATTSSTGSSGTGSGAAAVPRLAVGSLVAAIGIVAGILVL